MSGDIANGLWCAASGLTIGIGVGTGSLPHVAFGALGLGGALLMIAVDARMRARSRSRGKE